MKGIQEILLSEERINKLATEEYELLTEYDYSPTMEGIIKGLNVWNRNKATLRGILSNHPNWNEELQMICFDSDFDRGCNEKDIRCFSKWLDLICYYNNYPEELNIIDFGHIECFITSTHNHLLTKDQEEYINSTYPFIKAKEGMKITRIVNKFCKHYGIDKLSSLFNGKEMTYNQAYAKYCDAITPLKIKRHTLISINPLDYLTMSFGNSWSSCHTIDKKNMRGMPNSYEGMYSSGTMSYMLDETSLIFYTLSSSYEGDKPYLQGKINRNMFHYGNIEGKDILIQGRVYPQDCDGENGIYKDIRMILQKVFADCLEINNLWRNGKGSSICKRVSASEGTHYRDYLNYESCNVSVPLEQINDFEELYDLDEDIYIGHDPICPKCGEEHEGEDNIMCYNCNDDYKTCGNCGNRDDEDEMRWSEERNEYLCEDCAYYCDDCNSYFRDEDMIEIYDSYGISFRVCRHCAEDYYKCEACGDYFINRAVTRTEDTDVYFCNECRDNNTVYIDGEGYYETDYAYCDECDDPFKDDDIFEYHGKYYCSSCFEEKISENEEELAQ